MTMKSMMLIFNGSRKILMHKFFQMVIADYQ